MKEKKKDTAVIVVAVCALAFAAGYFYAKKNYDEKPPKMICINKEK